MMETLPLIICMSLAERLKFEFLRACDPASPSSLSWSSWRDG